MELGFDTIGNATLIAYDRGPILATDPWIDGSPYFGSWVLAHEVPAEQREAIARCPFVWISHGHPDHLDGDSLNLFKDATILLPDHRGSRIRDGFVEQGRTVKVLPDREWTQLSPNIRVLSIADYNQDALLLVDVGGTLLVDLNDASDHGWESFVKKTIREFRRSFLLRLTGYGDTDMINFHDEQGRRITPPAQLRKASGLPLGPRIAHVAESFGVTHTLPFSAMHRYQRADSVWASESAADVDDHAIGFKSTQVEMLPPYIRFDCNKGTFETIDPEATNPKILPPEAFGDNWSEQLERAESEQLEAYFRRMEHLPRCFDFLNFRVGGKDHRIELRTGKFRRGVTFEAPRHSLMTAVRYEIFDDLLIGNFMKTTLHGSWPASDLHPDFTPYVRYADNGRARTLDELKAYFAAYRQRLTPLERLRLSAKKSSTDLFRTLVPRESLAWKVARRLTVRR